MTEIDERVVEMRFNNKEFENGVKESLGTLDKLKSALNLEGAAKGFENIDKAANNMDLSGIAAGIEALQDRFSTFGIVGMRIIENITDSLIGLVTKGINYVDDAIISGGMRRAQNIENAHFQLQALLKDEEKVQAVMDNAMVSVDGTAYAYDEAAKAAAQFAASGLEAGEKMERALKGITGVAAMTNSEYEGISRIFTTIAGNNRLMGDQLLQLSTRGLNAASTIADYFREVRNQSNITEATVREMVSKGQIDFDTFASAMEWAFGESAFRANETFTGALSNMRSALARIGAGFFSPLIEQNSDLIMVINALRVRINDVKKALVFDEQINAISGLTKNMKLMTETTAQFVKDGSIGFDTIIKSIIGASKSEEELKEINEKLSESYNKVSESGYLTKDVFLEFSQNGIHTAKILREYLNGVMDGTVKASYEIKESVKQISNSTKLTVNDIYRLADEGAISYDLFTNAMVNASEIVTKESGVMNIVVTNLMNKVSEAGYLTKDLFMEFSQNGINTASALKQYLNGVTEGSIRATYSTRKAVEELTNGTKVTISDIHDLADEGRINYAIFQSAIENMYGDQKKLSKQFTEFFLDTAKGFANWLNNLDVTKPMEIMYYNVESIKNIFLALLSVLKPVGKAFLDIFLKDVSVDGLVRLAAKIEELTSKMKLSEKGSEDLHDAFEGIFSVVNLVIKGFSGLFGIVVPVNKPIKSLTDLILSLAGAMGRGLTFVTNWISKSRNLNKAYTFVASGVQKAMYSIADFISHLDEFGDYIYNLPIIQKIINNITKAFTKLYNKGEEYLPVLIERLKEFRSWVLNMVPNKVKELFDTLIEKLKDIKINLDGLSADKASSMFSKLTDSLKKLLEVFKGNEGIDTFINNIKTYFKNMADAFTFDRLLENIDKFKSGVGGFVDWIRDTIGPAFEDFSFGGAVATAGGFSIIYAVIQAVKAFNKVGSYVESVPKTLMAIKTTLVTYQQDLKADMMLKIAEAIAVLAVSLTILSFADMDHLWQAAIILSLIGSALIAAAGYLSKGLAAMKGIGANIYTVATQLSKGLTQLTKAVKWKAIGSAIKDMALALGIIVASIVVLAITYSKDQENLDKAVALVIGIATSMIGIIALMSSAGDKIQSGMKSFAAAAGGILMMSASIIIVIGALKSLFKMNIPSDWGTRLTILGGIFVGLGVLAIILGLVTKNINKSSLQSITNNTRTGTFGKEFSTNNGSIAGSIIGMAAALYIGVLAIKKLFDIDLPSDYKTKFGILAALFSGFVVAILAIGLASKMSQEGLKGTGTILAMCIFIATAVGALGVLSLFPAEKLLTGAITLGITLIALAVALAGAGRIAGKDSWKTILAMALEIGAIATAIGVLSMIPTEKLLVAAIALSGVLYILAVDSLAVSQITNKLQFASIIAMAAMVGVIATSLYVLAKQPWSSLLAAAVSLSAVLLAVAGTFKIMESSKINPIVISEFLIGILGVLVTSLALTMLASQPWENIIAGAVALGTVLISIAASFAIMSAIKPNLTTLVGFIAGIIGIGVIALILHELAKSPWENLLAAAGAISLVLVSLAAAMALCTVAGAAAPAALAGMGMLDLFIGNLALILFALGNLSEDAEAFLDRGGEILKKLGTYLGEFIGSIIAGAITSISGSLVEVGSDLSKFAVEATPFFEIMGGLKPSVLSGAKNLASTILTLTAAELVNGIASFLVGDTDFSEFGKSLKDFGEGIKVFADEVAGISDSDVEAASNCALALAGLYNNLPKRGGWLQQIVGEQQSLTSFAKGLQPFGKALAEYSAEVDGKINKDAVEASINAATIIRDFYNKMPKTGGWMQVILGEQKTLSEFGRELLRFGEKMVEYCKVVGEDGAIDEQAIQASIDAATILKDFADTMPDMGGLMAVIFGDQKTLSEFAEELVPFARGMVNYSNEIKSNGGIDSNAIALSVEAAEGLVALQGVLEKSGGFLSLFTGSNDLDKFGSQLKKFGQGLSGYSDSVKGINTYHLNNVITEINRLVEVANTTNSLNMSGMTDFANALKTMGNSGIDSFIQSFTNSTDEINTAVNGFITNVTTALVNKNSTINETAKTSGNKIPDGIKSGIDEKQSSIILTISNLAVSIISTLQLQLPTSTFTEIGQTSMTHLLNGIVNKKPTIITNIKTICSDIINQFKVSLSSNTFEVHGKAIIQSLIAGIQSNSNLAISTATNTSNLIIQTFSNTLTKAKMSEIGGYAAQGLADGIQSKISSISSAATQAANEAITSAKKTLQIRSPSRVLYEIGQYVSEGLANGIRSEIGIIGDASEDAAESSIDIMNRMVQTISATLNDNPDFQPTVRPVIDLSNVEQGIDQITAMFNQRFAATYDRVMEASNSFEIRNNRIAKDNGNKDASSDLQPSYQFIQNNYSPKAISRLETYRDTKNLLTQIQRVGNGK